jgi:hypothetical protein
VLYDILNHTLILADSSVPFSTNGSQQVTEVVSGAYDYVWQTSMTSGFYRILANIGSLIGLCCLMFFIVNFAKSWLRDEVGGNWVLGELVLPLVVVALLANGGTAMMGGTQALRGVVNNFNRQVMNSFTAEISMEEALSQIADYSSAYQQIVALREQCNVLIQQESLSDCLETQNQYAQGILDLYKEAHSTQPGRQWSNYLADLVGINRINPTDPLGSAIAISTLPLNLAILPGRVIGDGVRQLPALATNGTLRMIESFLVACQAAFQYVIELSWLATALVAPIAVGLSLMPDAKGKPLIAWLTGFFSLGMCKLCLNLITGLFALMVVKMGPVDALPHAVVIGLLGPILALVIAAGGGMAVFNGILSASQWAAGTAAGGLRR